MNKNNIHCQQGSITNKLINKFVRKSLLGQVSQSLSTTKIGSHLHVLITPCQKKQMRM